MAKIYKCAIYARVSTSGQVNSKDEDSVDRQVEMLKGLITSKGGAENGWILDEKNIFRDEGVSAKTLNRPSFKCMQAKIEKGEINTILATRYDRLSRSVIDFLTFFEEMRKINVEIIVSQGHCDTTDAQGIMTLTVLMALAQFSRQQTQMATKQAMIMLADKGRWRGGIAPFGFSLGSDIEDGKKGWLYVNEEQFFIVEMIFDLYIQHRSASKVEEILNAHGYIFHESYTSRREKTHEEHKFTKNIIYRILKDKIYLGKMVYNKRQRNEDGKIIKNNENTFEKDAVWKYELPRTIPIEKFNLVQDIIQAKRKNPGEAMIKHSYIFGPNTKEGINTNEFINPKQAGLYCNKCKQYLKGTSGQKTSLNGVIKRYYYYHHSDRNKSKSEKCPIMTIPAVELEKLIINRIFHLINSEDLFNNIVKKTEENQMSKIKIISKQIFTLKQKLTKLKDERKIKMKMCQTPEDFDRYVKPYLDDLTLEEKNLETSLSELNTELNEFEKNKIETNSLKEKMKEIMNVFELLDETSIQMICKLLIESVKITPGETINDALDIEINLWGKLPELVSLKISDLTNKKRLDNFLLPSPYNSEFCPELRMAPVDGLEPPTQWLTATCSTG